MLCNECLFLVLLLMDILLKTCDVSISNQLRNTGEQSFLVGRMIQCVAECVRILLEET